VLCLWWLYINDGRLVIEDFNLKRIEPFFYLLIIKEIYVGNLFPAINSVYFIIIYIVLVHIWDSEDVQNVHCYYLERHCKHDYWPVDDSILGGTYKPNNLSLNLFINSTYQAFLLKINTWHCFINFKRQYIFIIKVNYYTNKLLSLMLKKCLFQNCEKNILELSPIYHT
jgi:hypothetical protein